MNLLARSAVALLLVAIIATVVLVYFARRFRVSKWPVVCVVFVWLLALGGVARVFLGAPGLIDTVPQDERSHLTDQADRLIERLRQSWDSDAVADWQVGETMATLCQIAYQPPIDAEETYQKLGFKEVKTFVDASLIGYVLLIDDTSVVVFRGTDDKADWAYNLNNFTTTTPAGPIHGGFYGAYAPLKPQIAKILRLQKPKQLWITGHSLGGALAAVCAYDLIENEQLPIQGIMTFGQPMIAGRKLAESLDITLSGKYVHYVNETDIVPRVHPSLYHFGSLVWFTEGKIHRNKPKLVAFGAPGGNHAMSDSVDGLPPLSDEEFEAFKEKMSDQFQPVKEIDGHQVVGASFPFIQDHSMDQYLEKIRSLTKAIEPRDPFNSSVGE